MTTLANALNGGKVALFADTPSGFVFIGGQTAHSRTITLEAIDISNKAAPNDREFLEGEGRTTADITAEIIYSTDVAYEFLVAQFDAKTSFDLQVRAIIDGDTIADTFKVFVTAIGDNPALNAAYSSSITLTNTEDFTIKITLVFAQDTGGDQAVDSGGIKALAEA